MQKIEIEVTERDLKSDEMRNPNKVRRDGLVPAVVYGHGKPVPVVVNARVFNKAISGKAGTNALFTVKLGGKSDLSIIKEVQRDIFTRLPIHIDFLRISLKEKLEVTIPIHLLGEAPGVKVQQGILEQIQREVKLKCLPDDIPVSIDVDISKLELHHSVKVQDLVPPKGVEFITTGDHIVVTIVTAKVEEEVAKPAEGLEATQPEVIAKGKKDEEGAVAAAPAAGGKAAPAPAAEGDKKKAK